MKLVHKKVMCGLLASVFLVSNVLPAAAFAAEEDHYWYIDSAPVADYAGDYEAGQQGSSAITGDNTHFYKISHLDKPVSQMEHDPKESPEERELHQSEVFADGVLDYLGNELLGVPYIDEGANGQGARGLTYSWAGFAYGDWMYVGTLYNSTEQTGRLLGSPIDPQQQDEAYGGDLFIKEEDDPSDGPSQTVVPAGTLSKINVKTGEVKIIMSKYTNGLEPSFRNAVEYHGKLYFCGSVNHLPRIYEVDPETDAFRCVYEDPSIMYHPGGPNAAYAESMAKEICPTIRGLAVFQDYLIISAVGTDGNPYIAASQDPSQGFTPIAYSWVDMNAPTLEPAQLFGYPACKLPDSIMGGSVWEMAEFNGNLYVAIATGTPANAPEKHPLVDENGNPKLDDKGNQLIAIDTMQSFALVRGEYHPEASGDAANPLPVDNINAWTWTPVIGDKADGAKYTFGIDPERTRSGACNLVVFDDHLYIGEYNDTQIAFKNMVNGDYQFLARNLEQSISLYRMDENENIEKVMGSPTKMFPEKSILSGITDDGFGQHENQYIWQSRVFDGKLYLGTFDETMILDPLASAAAQQAGQQKKELDYTLNGIDRELDKPAVMRADADSEVLANLRDVRDSYTQRMENVDLFAEAVAGPENSESLLPGELFEGGALVKVDSYEDLYLAMLVISDVLESPAKSTRDQLAMLVQYTQLYHEVAQFVENHPEEIPSVMSTAADTLAGDQNQNANMDALLSILQYMKNCIAGFDFYVTEDGIHFKQLTRSGMGDPYNQGLRVFAVNNDPANPWMCIGTANPFYGTQIWRMNHDGLVEAPIDPAQEFVYVRFIAEENGQRKVLDRVWDRPDRIYVTEGTTTVAPSAVEMLLPADCEIVSQEPVAIQVIDGVKTVEFPVVTYTKEVNVQFADQDMPEGTNIVGNGTVRVGQSVNKLTEAHVKDLLPAGYVIQMPATGTDIQEVSGNYTAIVPVRRGFSVTVEGGSAMVGTSTVTAAAVGSQVNLKANIPDGAEFVRWDAEPASLVLADATSANTSFTMPAENVKLTAVYQIPSYNITIADSVGGSVTATVAGQNATEAHKGDRVILNVTPNEGFYLESIEVSTTVAEGETAAPVTVVNNRFDMPAQGVTVKATFADTYTAKVVDGTGAGAYHYGETVTLTADVAEGSQFHHWVLEGVTVEDTTAATITFPMPANDVTAYAKTRRAPVTYTLTVENGTGSGTYAFGEQVTITANAPEEGKVFSNWTSPEGVIFADAAAAETTLTMRNVPVTVVANYVDAEKDTQTVTVNGGTGSGEYLPGAEVTITAAEIEGRQFTDWTIDGVEVEDVTANSITFVMPENPVTATANGISTVYTVSGAVQTAALTHADGQPVADTEILAALTSGDTLVAEVEVVDGRYTIANVLPGTYTLEVTKYGHADRTYEVTVEAADVVLDAQLNPMGDINLDGVVDTRDLNQMTQILVNNAEQPTGYALACANVSGREGKVRKADHDGLKAHLLEKELLW